MTGERRGADERTLAFYDENAEDYAQWSGPASPRGYLRKFMSLLPPDARVLDLGCGSGWASADMRDAGLTVASMDGSARMADEARRRHGIDVRVARFDALDDVAAYDGVWASFSLLHAPRAEMPANLARIRAALRPGGRLYVGLKEGEGEMRDTLGRFYALYRADELRALLDAAGFDEIEIRERASTGFDGTPSPILHGFARRRADDASGDADD